MNFVFKQRDYKQYNKIYVKINKIYKRVYINKC